MRRYGIIVLGAVVALAAVFGAYRIGRGAAPSGTEDIGEETAKAIALRHAAVSESDLSSYEIARDEAGGSPVYEVEFTADSGVYAYVVNAASGSIVKFRREAGAAAPLPAEPEVPSVGPAPAEASAPASVPSIPAPAPIPASATGVPAPSEGSAPQDGRSDIGEARAKEIALRHAGVTADSISDYSWELDVDGGVSVYELEFLSGGYEYDYEISAADGTVVKFEKEAVQSAQGSVQGTLTADAVSYIGEARAREIACGHAGLTADAVTHCGVELDHHGGHGSHHGTGCCTYEIGFKSGGYEYEYKIDAVTGAVLGFEQELDD